MSAHILVVEDQPFMRRALVALFEKVGLETSEAATLDQALQQIRSDNTFDVVCLDLMLPDGSGVEVLKEIRDRQLSPKVAVVSGANEAGVLSEVTALRPDAIFGKPLDLPDFFSWFQSTGFQFIPMEFLGLTPPGQRKAAG